MFLKQSLERGDILGYSWIQGEKIVVDGLTKQGSRREALQEIVIENKFRNAQKRDNWVNYGCANNFPGYNRPGDNFPGDNCLGRQLP